MNSVLITPQEQLQKEKTHTSSPRRVCFVCTGNTCRSPMAEAVANAMAHAPFAGLAEEIQKCLVPSVEAFSAGLYPHENEPIAANAVYALEDAGIAPTPGHDYRTHTAHALRAETVQEFDLLIGMTAGHAMELMMRFPQMAQRIVCMPREIVDPYGGNLNTYRQCLKEITEGVRELLFSEDVHDG